MFTKQYAAVLGGKVVFFSIRFIVRRSMMTMTTSMQGAPMYQLFVQSACKAYEVVRKHCALVPF